MAEIGGGVGALSRALAKFVESIDFYEPSVAINSESFAEDNIHLISEMFTQAYKQYNLVIMKQVCEHIPDFFKVLKESVNSLSENGLLYIEVPNVEYIFKFGSIVDFHYPHIHYFSESFLRQIFNRLALTVVNFQYLKGCHDMAFLLAKSANHSVNVINYPSCFSYPGFSTKNVDLSCVYNNGIDNLQSIAKNSFSLYGANAYSQSFLSLFSHYTENLVAIYDDSPIGPEKCSYNNLRKFDVLLPKERMPLAEDAIIITSYLHDLHISQKLKKLGFGGKVYTVRSFLELTSGGTYSIFKPIESYIDKVP